MNLLIFVPQAMTIQGKNLEYIIGASARKGHEMSIVVWRHQVSISDNWVLPDLMQTICWQ